MIKVLIVDDSALVRKLLGSMLAGEPDIEVAYARNGQEALSQMEALQPDVMTLDFHMPDMDGLACLDRIMVERPCPVLMLSSFAGGDDEVAGEALRRGAVDVMAKPGGVLSLHVESFRPAFVTKLRKAAGVKLRASQRLRERVAHRIRGSEDPKAARSSRRARTAGGRGPGVVVVGSSTGGPSALEAVLRPIPADFPWPIVIAQHMPMTFTAHLAKRLDSLCALGVVEVAAPERLAPGRAYIGRGDGDIVLIQRGGDILAAPAEPSEHLWHPSAERLVESAMEFYAAERIVGVLLTGMGNDGAIAMSRLHAAGGATIAEAESTAAVWGMPGELVKLEGATWVLPVHRIAEKLLAQVRHAADQTIS